MSLTLSEIYSKYNNIDFIRNIYVKRKIKTNLVGNIFENSKIDTLDGWSSNSECSIALDPGGYEGTCLYMFPNLPVSVERKQIYYKQNALIKTDQYNPTYILKFYAKGTISFGTPYISIRLNIFSEEDQQGTLSTVFSIANWKILTNDWLRYGLLFSINIPGTYKSFELMIQQFTALSSPDFDYYFDNFELFQVPVYEDQWYNLRDLIDYNLDVYTNIIIDKGLPNDTYSLGHVSITNTKLEFLNKNGQLSDELNKNSIFYDNFIRHESLIKIEEGYIDRYTDPDNPIEVVKDLYYGVIDDTNSSTLNKFNEILAVNDYLTFILNRITINDLIFNYNNWYYDLITNYKGYDIVNSIFQDIILGHYLGFIDAELNAIGGIDTLNLGWDIDPSISNNSYRFNDFATTTSLLTIIQNVCLGHSVFYLKYNETRNKNRVYINPIENFETTTIYNFNENPERKIKLNKIDNGSKQIISHVIVKTLDNIETEVLKLNPLYKKIFNTTLNLQTFNIEAENYANYLLTQNQEKKLQIELNVIFFPLIDILDRIKLKIGEIITESDIKLNSISISESQDFFVKRIKHNGNLTTTLTLVEYDKWILDYGYWDDSRKWIDTKQWRDSFDG